MSDNYGKRQAPPGYVLNVRHSATGQSWCSSLEDFSSFEAEGFAQRHGISDVLARILVSRGVRDSDMPHFLTPRLRDLMPDPAELVDMECAAARLIFALKNNETIAVFGDYDVDGATSCALMIRFLRHFGVDPLLHIPDRLKEGYGPNIPAFEALRRQGARLILTLDCGGTGFEPLEWAQKNGVDVVVLDHHQMGEILPPAVALVNPNRQDDLSGQEHLAAVGVVYLFLVCVVRHLRKIQAFSEKIPDLRSFLDLVALGTVCDVVPLRGLNRAYVVQGLKILRKRVSPGLVALCDTARLSGPTEVMHLGYALGPRINAAGRIGDPRLGTQLLVCPDPTQARLLALRLESYNRERQSLEMLMLEEAEIQAGQKLATEMASVCLLVASQGWHPGIIGLLAARLKEKYHLPAFVIAYDSEGKGVGSARSVGGVDVGKVVRAAVTEGILERGGGHKMAAGFSLRKAKESDFEAFIQIQSAEESTASESIRRLYIDGVLTAQGATEDFVQRIEQAGPYGAGHHVPILAFPHHTIRAAMRMGTDHLRVTLASASGHTLRAVAFRAADHPLGSQILQALRRNLHIAGTLNLNHWQGRRTVQLRILDAADPLSCAGPSPSEGGA